jgi:hypothetical protein
MKEIVDFITPLIKEAQEQRQKARQALGVGVEAVERGFTPDDKTLEEPSLPIGGEKKYNKQEPGGQMTAVNIEENSGRVEKDETKTIAVHGFRRFNDMPINIVNTSQIPLRVTITEITSTVDQATGKSAYIIRIDDVLHPVK